MKIRLNRNTDLLKNFYQKGFFHLLTSNFLIQLVAFASQFLVAWILNPEDIGRIKVLQSFSSLAIIFAGFGLNTSTLKLCSEKRNPNDKKKLLGASFLLTTLLTLIVMATLYIANYYGLLSKDRHIQDFFSTYLIVILPLTLNLLFIAYLQALKKMKMVSKIQFITKLITVILIITLTYQFLLNGFIWATIIGLFITMILFIILLKNDILIDLGKLKELLNVHRKYASYSFLANAINNVGIQADIFIINYLIVDRLEVGYYGFALTVLLAFQLLTGTIQQFATPFLSEISHDLKSFKATLNKFDFKLLISGLLLVIVGFVTVGPLINLAFSGKYEASIPFFNILIIGWFFKYISSLKAVAFIANGMVQINTLIVTISTIITILATYFFVQSFGTIGAAYGMVTNRVITFTLLQFFNFQKIQRVTY